MLCLAVDADYNGKVYRALVGQLAQQFPRFGCADPFQNSFARNCFARLDATEVVEVLAAAIMKPSRASLATRRETNL